MRVGTDKTSAYRNAACLLLALIGAMAINSSGYAVPSDQGFMAILKGELGGMGLPTVLIFVGLAVFYLKYPSECRGMRSWVIWALAVLFGVFALTGQSFISNGSWDLLFGSMSNFVVGCIMLIGETYLFYRLIYCLFGLLEGQASSKQAANSLCAGVTGARGACNSGEPNNQSCAEMSDARGIGLWGRKLVSVFQRYPFMSAWILFIVLWLPYSLVFLPGCINNDDLQNITALLQGGTCQEVSTMPLYLLLIPIYKLGALISDNAGLLLMSRVTCLISSACCAGIYATISKWDVSKWIKRGVLIFYGLVPLVGPYSMVVRKDTFYAAVLSLYVAKTIDLYLKVNNSANTPTGAGAKMLVLVQQLLDMTLLSIAVCVTRPNGIYVIVVADALLAVACVMNAHKGCITTRDQNKTDGARGFKYAIAPVVGMLASIAIYIIVTAAFSGYQMQGTVRRETNGLRFQQTARYIRDYADEVTAQEKAAISAVLDYDYISASYDPELHDPVKYTYKLEATDSEWDAYKKAWRDMFKKHPECYVNAWVGNFFGYFDPFHYHSPQGSYTWNVENDGDTYEFSQWMPASLRSLLTNLVMLWAKIPVMGQLIWCGTYTWIIMLCFGYAIYAKRFKELLLYAAPILSIAVCLLSPVNGSVRYMLPVIEMVPVFICLTFISSYRRKLGSNL